MQYLLTPPGDAAASNALTTPTRFDDEEKREHEYLPPNEMLPASQFHHRLIEQQPMIPHSIADLSMASRGCTDEQELLAYQSFDFGFETRHLCFCRRMNSTMATVTRFALHIAENGVYPFFV